MANESTTPIPMPESFAKMALYYKMHLGCEQITKQMEKYVYKLTDEKVPVINLQYMWEKFVLAARVIAGIPDTNTIVAMSSKTFGSKPVLRFADSIGCRRYTNRFIPGSFTNRNVRNSCEPRLLIISDPVFDQQGLKESSVINCPTISFCDTDAKLDFVDIAIPVNNRSPKAIGACFFILARLVSYIKYGTALNFDDKEVELFFYRDEQELEEIEAERNAENALEFNEPAAEYQQDEEDFGVHQEVEVDAKDGNFWGN